MKTKKSPGIILVIAILAIFLLSQCAADDYARITDVDYKAIVVDEPGSQGKVVITERLTFDIHAASQYNLFWELWRDLPEDYIDGLDVYYKVNSVKQILSDGTEVIYGESDKLYWDDYDYESSNPVYGPGKWFHSPGPYNEDAERYECVFFYVDGLYREEVVFEIEYEMYNAALKYNDCSDLYLAMYSGETIPYLESYKAEILIPNKDMPSPGNYDVYSYGTNSNSFEIQESATKNPGYYTFSFELDEEDLQFKSYNEYIEFDLVSHGSDKHIFTEYAPDNYYTYDDVLEEIYAEQEDYASTPEVFKSMKTTILIICIALSVIVLLGGVLHLKKIKKKYKFYTPDHKLDTYRYIPSDLDPNFASALVFCKDKAPTDDSGIYSAILLNLARKKYIDIIERSSGDVLIIIKEIPQTPLAETIDHTDYFADEPTGYAEPEFFVEMEPLEPLTTCEEYYYNMIVRHSRNNIVHMNELQARISNDYDYTYSFTQYMKHSIVNIGVKEGYFQKADYMEPKNALRNSSVKYFFFGFITTVVLNLMISQTRFDLAFGAFFILGASCIVRAIYEMKNANKYILLTQFGETEYEKWRGLYNFLNSDTLMHERTVIELPLWERYLVYATAFGISQKVIDAISIRCPQTDVDSIVNNTHCRSGRIRSSGHSFRNSVRSGSFSRSSSSSGFGYGGGGRGGGGGGGGH